MNVPSLLAWFAVHGRDLPWRHTRDPYAIWLSEVILQQTRIAQGMSYWQRFMQRWPTVHDLAVSSEDEVLKMWQGLGYYSRARNLHTAARQVDETGVFPHTLETIRQLKGVGDYTAAAIAAFAFDIPVAAVDGNFYRVLSRTYGISTPVNTTEGKKVFTKLAQSLVPQDRAADFNQAMMDFGATWCTPHAPRCDDCPFVEECIARREHRVGSLPVKNRTVRIKERYMTYILIRCNGQVAIRQRGGGDIWQGLWEPFLIEGEDAPLPPWQGTFRQTGHHVRHVLTHRVIYADSYILDTTVRPPLPPDYIWVDGTSLPRYAVPRLIEILFPTLL